VRISGDEFEPGGQTIQETRYIAPLLVEAGADALHISAGTHNKTWTVEPPTGSAHAINASLAAAIKEVVSVPVISVGRIVHPWVAESVLAAGQADMVAMGRALLADPEFPNKAASGDWDNIAPCVGDLYCLTRLYNDKRISCLVNPTVGQEQDMILTRAENLKKILVIGGGPAGLEASRIAALRGHHVTLIEKDSQLGGQLVIASFPPMKQEFTCLIQFLVSQVYKAGVAVELNKEVTSELIDELHPDAVIISTGGMPMIPGHIPGIEGENVMTSWDVLAGKVLPKRRVLVIGGGSAGCEIADFITHPVNDLSPNGNQVTIMEMLDNVCLDDLSPRRSQLIQRLLAKGVRIMTGTRVTEVLTDGVRYQTDKMEKIFRGIDTIVLAMGTRAENLLVQELKNGSTPFFIIGDAKEPRGAWEAIAEGWEIGRKI
jgi:NADPH-dependent 2,4-dienoyl-CoA reductase/sulfur reductase-like enzyme